MPQILLDLSDRLVILKPPGWEVEDGHTEFQLLEFLRSSGAGPWPILDDAGHHNGLLHRLDVPCSGLVLMAKSYRAYYDLKLQLNAGGMARDYVVLCHGTPQAGSFEVNEPVYWREWRR